MIMTRKNFLKSASIITGGVLFGSRSLASSFIKPVPGFKELRNNVGIYTEKGGTMGWYFSGDSSVVIDSQFPDTAKNFLEEFRKKTPGRIDVLFNTHHHRDHTSGNFF
jgi:cyclase